MLAFIGVIGFLGIIIGIIIFIVDKIKKKKSKGGLIAIVSLLLFSISVFTPSSKVDETSNDVTEEETTNSESDVNENEVEETGYEEPEEEVEVEEPVELTPQQKMIQDIVSLIDSKQAFDTGSYTKGDIPVGEYAYIPFDGSGQYYAEKDVAGNIIDNENFDSFGYVYVHDAGNIETNGVLINTQAFSTLGVNSAKEIYEILNNTENYRDSAWYKVGVDLPAGQYTIQSYGEGYVAIMSGPIGNNDIVDNQIFNGKYTVNVKDGQYLKVSNSAILQ